jgi:hypothetical protein
MAEVGAGRAASPQLTALIARYAESVPGALEPGRTPEFGRIRAAAELARIQPADLAERHAAAERLGELPERHGLWGRPALIETGARARRSSG